MIVLQSTTRRVPLVLPPKNSVGQTGICLRKTGTNGQFQQERCTGMTVSDKSSQQRLATCLNAFRLWSRHVHAVHIAVCLRLGANICEPCQALPGDGRCQKTACNVFQRSMRPTSRQSRSHQVYWELMENDQTASHSYRGRMEDVSHGTSR